MLSLHYIAPLFSEYFAMAARNWQGQEPFGQHSYKLESCNPSSFFNTLFWLLLSGRSGKQHSPHSQKTSFIEHEL
jgi:hypothetical protein